jgi:hypothetical protein
MDIERNVVFEKKERETPSNQCAPVLPFTTHKAALSPANVGASHQRTAAFDPSVILTKLSGGRTTQEYQADESIFSQGDAASFL